MKRLTILGIIACVGLLFGPAAVLGAGPPGGLDVNVVSPDPLPVTGDVNATVTGEVDVNVVNTPVYRFAGFSPADTNGDTDGIGGMHVLCEPEYGADSRMCTTKELLLSPNVPTGTGGSQAWVQPTIVTTAVVPGKGLNHFDYSGTFYPFQGGTCYQWNTATPSPATSGMAFSPTTGTVGVTSCSSSIPVACCTPAN